MQTYRVTKSFRAGASKYKEGQPITLGTIQHRALYGRGVVSKDPIEKDEPKPGKGKGPSKTKTTGPSEVKVDESKILDIAWINEAGEALDEDNGTKIRAALSKVVEGSTPNSKKVNKKALKRAVKLAEDKLAPPKG